MSNLLNQGKIKKFQRKTSDHRIYSIHMYTNVLFMYICLHIHM
jgi:hypothetical protein